MRIIGIPVAAVLLAGLVVQNGIARGSRHFAPDFVIGVSPHDAHANAGLAERLVQPGASATAITEGVDRARAALLRDPTSVEAARTLGLAGEIQGKAHDASSAMAYSRQLSRRDLPTTMWLLEHRVAAGDVRGALTQFDIGLRSAREAGNLLLPVLVGAASDPAVARELVPLLASRPPWTTAFYYSLLKAPPGVAASLVTAVHRMGTPIPTDVTSAIVGALAGSGDVSQGLALYRLFGPADRGSLLRNGTFDRDPEAVPFDWSFSSDELANVSREATAGGTAVGFQLSSGFGGTIMRQLLVLTPGRYRLGGDYTVDAPANPRLVWQATCVTSGEHREVALLSRPGRFDAEFAVSATCAAFWLSLDSAPVEGVEGITGTIRNLSITGQPNG